LTTARSSQLDGVRALAALSVVCFHAWLYRVGEAPGERTSVLDKALFEASIGLVCFFVLSGFLLYRPFARAALNGTAPVSLRRYAVRRAARIVPAYYACLVGCLLIFSALGYSSLLPPAGRLPVFALFGQNYSADTVMKINPVIWTLGVEASFYVLLPVIAILAFRFGPRRPGRQAVVLAGLVALTVAWNLLLHSTRMGPLASKMLPAYLGHFALGMLAALWMEWRLSRRGSAAAFGPAPTAALMALGLSIVVAASWWHETAGSFTTAWLAFGSLPSAVGFALVVAAAAAGVGPAVSWLRARPLAAVGVVSYGIYLWHLPLILVARELGLLPAAFAPRLVLVAALAIAAGALSWLLVERPVMRFAAGGFAVRWPLRFRSRVRPVYEHR
jgi:peptidoglycan/LPS O-acetylase OafA/YrhL